MLSYKTSYASVSFIANLRSRRPIARLIASRQGPSFYLGPLTHRVTGLQKAFWLKQCSLDLKYSDISRGASSHHILRAQVLLIKMADDVTTTPVHGTASTSPAAAFSAFEPEVHFDCVAFEQFCFSRCSIKCINTSKP